MLKTFVRSYQRLVPDNPIYSKYDGTCKVCGKDFYKGELISPFFDHDYNFWRHTDCLQLFLINMQRVVMSARRTNRTDGYWSKHNGIWCTSCGEAISNVTVAYYNFKNITIFEKNEGKKIWKVN